MWKTLGLAALFSAGAFLIPSDANAQSVVRANGFYPRVIARGEDRQIIESTPIESRPYRPLHFYGNTVRRQYFRTGVVPNNPFRPFSRRSRSGNRDLQEDPWIENSVENGPQPEDVQNDSIQTGQISDELFSNHLIQNERPETNVFRRSVIRNETFDTRPAPAASFIWPAKAPRGQSNQ